MILIRVFCGIFVSFALLGCPGMNYAEPGFVLVTLEEYAHDQASKIRYKALVVPETGAPTIEIVEPQQQSAIKVPINIHIRFTAVDDAHIVVDTVRVLYGWLRIDITERIRKHAAVTSTGIIADNAELPTGSHRITIRVADSKNRQAENTFQIRVVK